MSSPLRLLIVGAGAVGGYFGARLAEAGRDVTFLVRPARAERLRADGLQIKSPHGDLTIAPKLLTPDRIEGGFDAILLAVKGPALAQAMQDFAPAAGPETMILPVLNGMHHIDALQQRFGPGAVIGGVCLVATQLDDTGRIEQIAPVQILAYGELDDRRSARIAALDATLQGAGFDASISPGIVQAMWNKWVQLASVGAITTLLDAPIGPIVAAGGASTALAIVDECQAIAAACGHPAPDAFIATLRETVTQPGSPFASSLFRDMRAGRPLEHDAILGDLLRRGQSHGVVAPLLAAALAKLQVRTNGLA